MTGYSLHIGLNHVDPTAYNGWDGALSGCLNDANSMQQLATQAGFQTTMLTESQATSYAVVSAISGLAQNACSGDICLITYSGHGGQVDDLNGDEDDTQDETWVLWDRQVVDDELHQLWSQFRAGVRVLVLSDSCHSGTVAKSMIATKSRELLAADTSSTRSLSATSEAPAERPLATTPKHMPYATQRFDNQRRRGTYQFVQALSGPRALDNVTCSVLLISGCQDNQLSYDGAVNGQFTGTLLNVWNQGSFSGDYQAFHTAILAQMPPDQSPNLYPAGVSDPAFLAQKPFTVAAPNGTNGMPSSVQPNRPTLREGDTGPDVVYLQQRLNAYGASLVADGTFGPMTSTAVRNFQSTHGLVADGVVGPMTWNALGTVPISAGGAGGSAGSTSGGAGGSAGGGSGVPSSGGGGGGTTTVVRATIRRGSTGADVQYLQQRLAALGYWISADGIFGPGTESTVRSFQSSQGLTADGVVGPATWAALG